MPSYTTLEALFAYLQAQINDSLEIDVADEVVKVVQEHIKTDVYDAYTPLAYQRTNELLNDVQSEMNGDTLEIYDTRNENGKDIPQIIETGKGYTWGGLDERIGPRPFMENAEQQIIQDDLHTAIMKDSLRRKGFTVE